MTTMITSDYDATFVHADDVDIDGRHSSPHDGLRPILSTSSKCLTVPRLSDLYSVERSNAVPAPVLEPY